MATTSTSSGARHHRGAVQLSLIPNDEMPTRFQLDAATVRRGRRHIAEIRQMLRSQHEVDAVEALPPPRRGDHPQRSAA